jgi:hypothetical protein
MNRATHKTLSRLADANPVTADRVSGDDASAQAALTRILAGEHPMSDDQVLPRPRHRRHRQTAWLLTPAVLVAAAVAAVLVVTTTGGPSIVSRALAAIDTNRGVVHFLEITRTTRSSGPETVRSEIWLSGVRSHSVSTTRMHLGPKDNAEFQIETAINGDQAQTYTAGTILKTKAAPRACAPRFFLVFDCGERQASDPFAVVRALYRSGRLHSAGPSSFAGRQVDVITGTDTQQHPAARVRILVDPTTFLPLEIQERSRTTTQTTVISDYQRLPLVPATRPLLALRQHPHAPVRQAPCGWSAANTAHGLQNLRVEKCPKHTTSTR